MFRSENPHSPCANRPAPSDSGRYRIPAEERASRIASRLRQKSMCSFKPWLSVTNVREHTGQCCSVLSSLRAEVGREGEFVPPSWKLSDISSGPSSNQGSSSSCFSPSISPLVLRRLLGPACAPVGSKNCSRAGSVSNLFAW